jgi:hypothetical protein
MGFPSQQADAIRSGYSNSAIIRHCHIEAEFCLPSHDKQTIFAQDIILRWDDHAVGANR